MSGTLTGASVTFGTDDCQSVIGIVQSESDKTSAEIAEARDEEGKVFAMKAYSKSRERTFEALFEAGTTPPAAGASITVGDWTGIVMNATVTKSNKDFTKISVTAQLKDAAGVIAYA